MKFILVKRGDNEILQGIYYVDVFVQYPPGATFKGGTLHLTQKELENLEFILQEGVSRLQEKEIEVETRVRGSQKAFTEGVDNDGTKES